MVTRPLIPANGPPGQLCAPCAKATFRRAFFRSIRSSDGHSKRFGARFAAPGGSITVAPAGRWPPPSVVGAGGQPKVTLDRALKPQHLFGEVRNAIAIA